MRDSPPDGVHHETDAGGRPALRLVRGHDEALVARHGGQVLWWRRRGRDLLWQASRAEFVPQKPVRGGVPLVFPWFGDHPTDPGRPAHGFARNLEWQLRQIDPTPSVTLAVLDDDLTRTLWPHRFALSLRVALEDGLSIELTVLNRGAEPFVCEEALHTYFAVGDVRTASVHGLEGVPCTEHAAVPEGAWDGASPLRFRAETDRIFAGVPDRIELRAPALRRTVHLTAAGARSAVVWNPWPAKAARLPQMAADDWRAFVCIETANVREHALRLDPGATHTLRLRLDVADHDGADHDGDPDGASTSQFTPSRAAGPRRPPPHPSCRPPE